jgi:hypothetical protein
MQNFVLSTVLASIENVSGKVKKKEQERKKKRVERKKGVGKKEKRMDPPSPKKIEQER